VELPTVTPFAGHFRQIIKVNSVNFTNFRRHAYLVSRFRKTRICRLTSRGAGPPGRSRAFMQAAGLRTR
jgi:hypothetical protein